MSANREASPVVHSVSALLAGVISTSITHPLDLIKARFQVQHVTKQQQQLYGSVTQAFKMILRSEGMLICCLKRVSANDVKSC